MSKTQRELLSQNFLWNRELVNKLIRSSSISSNDSVLEIGAGKGIITEQLIGICRKLTAIEADQKLLSHLRKKLPIGSSFSLFPGDFLNYPLPQSKPFKVFSNIPFSVTGEIVKKLLFSQNPPVDSYLVIQKEAAEKFIVNNYRNTMLSVIFHPVFDIKIIHNFKRTDFRPVPRIDSCLVRLARRNSPLVERSLLSSYRDFIVYHFTRDRSASTISPEEWRKRFKMFLTVNDLSERSKVSGSFNKWRSEERKLSKIHRTRTDKGWWKQKTEESW